jgi:FSR family fosmidomycin resistance protein-like MFS transporter
MRRLTLPIILGLAHGVADGAAGLLLGGLPRSLPLAQVALLVLLYNVLAFGGQPLIGALADTARRPRAAALVGLLLLCGALLAGDWQVPLAVVLAGLGSAAFHVGGGALALCATRGRAAGPGLFAAPGVVGLAAGGALAATGSPALWPLLIPLLMLVGLIATLDAPALPYATPNAQRPAPAHQNTSRPSPEPIFEGHDLIMLVLLVGISLRSAIWTSLQFLFQGRVDLLLALAVAAAAGKILGGVLADRVGWRRWTIGALALAAPLLALGDHQLLLLLPGVALLQSTTPVLLAASARALPRAPATAAGLALGLAIAIGALPSSGGLASAINAPPVMIAILSAALLAVWWALRPRMLAQRTFS